MLRMSIVHIFLLCFSASLVGQELEYNLLESGPICTKKNFVYGDVNCIEQYAKQMEIRNFDIEYLEKFFNKIVDAHVQKNHLKKIDQILRNTELSNLLKNIPNSIIVAKGIGLSDKEIKKKLDQVQEKCDAGNFYKMEGKSYSHIFKEILKHQSQRNTNPKAENQRKLFFKTFVIAYLEADRIRQMLEKIPLQKKQTREIINNLKERLHLIYHRFPFLTHIDKRGISGKKLTTFISERISTQHKIDFLDLRMGIFYTHPKIDEILKLPGNNLPTTFTSNNNLFHTKKFQNTYSFLYKSILRNDFDDVWLKQEIIKTIKDNFDLQLENMSDLCTNNYCENFNKNPSLVSQLVKEIAPVYIKSSLEKYICQCNLRHMQQTINPNLRTGAGLNALGFGIGCIFFQVLCPAALVTSAATGVMTYQDIKDNHKNENTFLNLSRQNATGAYGYEHAEISLNKLVELQKKKIRSRLEILSLATLSLGTGLKLTKESAQKIEKVIKKVSRSSKVAKLKRPMKQKLPGEQILSMNLATFRANVKAQKELFNLAKKTKVNMYNFGQKVIKDLRERNGETNINMTFYKLGSNRKRKHSGPKSQRLQPFAKNFEAHTL